MKSTFAAQYHLFTPVVWQLKACQLISGGDQAREFQPGSPVTWFPCYSFAQHWRRKLRQGELAQNDPIDIQPIGVQLVICMQLLKFNSQLAQL